MKSHSGSGTLRIVGGEFRGRRLKILPHGQLRPTSDRIRETLFNWLAADVKGARCLDLFAGSGALGFEALSRGATWITFIEQHAKLSMQLRSSCRSLACIDRAEVLSQDAIRWLKHTVINQPYDIVFIDPPFSQSLWASTLEALKASACLHQKSLIYLEAPKRWILPTAFPWQIIKQRTAGEVGYYLLKPE